MTKATKTKLMALVIIDLCMVAYMIFEMSAMDLECECERLEFEDWLFVGPCFFILFGVIITVIYLSFKLVFYGGYYLYKKFGI